MKPKAILYRQVGDLEVEIQATPPVRKVQDGFVMFMATNEATGMAGCQGEHIISADFSWSEGEAFYEAIKSLRTAKEKAVNSLCAVVAALKHAEVNALKEGWREA